MQVRLCSGFILVKAHDGKGAEPDQPQQNDEHLHRAADASGLDIPQCTCTCSVWAGTSQMSRTCCPGTKHLYRTSLGDNPTHSGNLWWGECILGVALSIYPGCLSKNLLGHCFKWQGSRSWLSVIIHCQNQYGWQACSTDIYNQRAHFPGMGCQSHCLGPNSTPVITFQPT